MAILRQIDGDRTLAAADDVARELAPLGIEFERWNPTRPVSADAPAAEILAAYAPEIEKLKARGGYTTADVIDVTPSTPGLDAMLAKFSREHWHADDEVRFIVRGRGLFHIHPRDTGVVAIEVEAGDLIRVPRGTWHWFDLCADRSIRAIRLFQDPAGWVPNYTGSGVDARYQPICLGTAYIPAASRL